MFLKISTQKLKLS